MIGRSAWSEVTVSRSRATHLAGSTKNTRVSFNEVVAKIAGYCSARTFSYGVYSFM